MTQPKSRGFDWTAERLAQLEGRRLRRAVRDVELDGVRARVDGREVVCFASNDYLGLSHHPDVVEALRGATAAGSTGARLLTGARRVMRELEQSVAALLGLDDALLFSSGYLAALGAIPALSGDADVIASDARNHACLIDGVRLAGVPRVIYKEEGGDLPPAVGALAPRKAFVVTESAFGMDAAIAPLAPLAGAVERHGWQWLIDDAHAFGVVGQRGEGLAAPHARRTGGVVLGTLSKAVGAAGGLVAGPGAAIELLRSSARSFIFDTALPPAIADAALRAVELLPHMDAERDRIAALSRQLTAELVGAGIEARSHPSVPHIVVVVVGTATAALETSAALFERGIYAPAIRPPTVPEGGSRVRLSITADHTAADIAALARALRESRAPATAGRD